LLCGLRRSTSPPNSATIAGFAVLRQTNFRFANADTTCQLRFRLGRFEETESIADAWQMSKPRMHRSEPGPISPSTLHVTG
jgi:hypothetical protein